MAGLFCRLSNLSTCRRFRAVVDGVFGTADDQPRHLCTTTSIPQLGLRLSLVFDKPLVASSALRRRLQTGAAIDVAHTARGGWLGRYDLAQDRSPHPESLDPARSVVAALSHESGLGVALHSSDTVALACRWSGRRPRYSDCLR